MKTPNELNLQPPTWPNAAGFARGAAKETEHPKPLSRGLSTKTVEVIPGGVAKALLNMATNAWRIRVKLTDPRTGEPHEEIGKDELKKVNRYLEAIFESLSGIGMEVKDRTNEAFDYGLPENVVASQPQRGLTRETIIETIRPTIYWQGTHIAQQGEVVKGTPPEMPDADKV